MNDQGTKPEKSANPAGADETFGWTAESSESQKDGPQAAAERMLGQLQSMIDSLATQAAPVVRQIGAKAAELAAVAADKAGPIAHRAADATSDASVRIAERSRGIAADLRRSQGPASDANSDDGIAAELRSEADSSDASTAVASVLDGIDDATEQAAKDDPAEGSR